MTITHNTETTDEFKTIVRMTVRIKTCRVRTVTEYAMASLKLSNVQISKSLDSAEKRP